MHIAPAHAQHADTISRHNQSTVNSHGDSSPTYRVPPASSLPSTNTHPGTTR